MCDPYADGIPAQGLEVDVFDLDDAFEFLLLWSPGSFNRSSRSKLEITTEAAHIVEELGFLSLAIEQAAAYL